MIGNTKFLIFLRQLLILLSKSQILLGESLILGPKRPKFLKGGPIALGKVLRQKQSAAKQNQNDDTLSQ